MAIEHYPLYLASRPVNGETTIDVTDKFSGEVIARVGQADEKTIARACDAADKAQVTLRKMPAFERRAVLDHCVRRFRERAALLANTLCREAGKPIQGSRLEVIRLIDTFQIAADETTRACGEILTLDSVKRGTGYEGLWRRFPIGPCAFISPFNFPLNLAAHKIAPALAVGCPFVLKPASLTPLSALMIGEVLAETDLPIGAFSILPCSRRSADRLVTDERLKLLSFTGSPGVGWDLKARAGKKKVVLELGGNAACIIDEDADPAAAADRLAMGAFFQSGQSCISVQRILVHEAIYADLRDRLVTKTLSLKSGDPREESTIIGPMISEAEAVRLENWIAEAVSRGATVLCGGKRKGALIEATLLENVPDDCKVMAEETFGPVAVLSSFRTFDEALERVNRSRFGLQAGIFTRDVGKAFSAWERLDVGGVIIGDVPSWRADQMPYGGIKDSGLGREGVRFAMEDMTEIKVMVIRR